MGFPGVSSVLFFFYCAWSLFTYIKESGPARPMGRSWGRIKQNILRPDNLVAQRRGCQRGVSRGPWIQQKLGSWIGRLRRLDNGWIQPRPPVFPQAEIVRPVFRFNV
ncbi:hypothetical protein GCM10010400_27760 [Streptomyces aculeolatus]